MLEQSIEILKGIGEKILERKSYKILVCCFCFIAGIIAHSFVDVKINFFWIYNAGLLLAALIILFYGNAKIRLTLLGVFFVVLGFARFNFGIAENKILPDFWDKSVEVSGIILDEPINKIDKQQLIVAPQIINGVNFYGEEKILVSAGLYPKYFYGDKINFSCKLIKPEKNEDFDYARYLSIQNIHGLCYRPEINAGKALELSLQRNVLKNIFSFKNFLIEKLNLFLHEPMASFASGLILGARNSIPPGLLQNFSRTGTTHIIAVSGWNITFLGTIFMPFLFLLRIKRGQAFYIMVILIFLYALLVGLGASVLRAAIMGTIALWAQKTGRLNHAGRALLYGVALMFLINSRIVYDVGFWLSISATFGLIYFSAIANSIFSLSKIPYEFLRENLCATISAVIFTLPISSFVFGGFSLWALPANILILPFIAIVIMLSLAALPIVIFIPFMSNWLFLPSAAILNYIIGVVNFFGSIPFGYFNFQINFLIMIAIYAGLIYYTFQKLKNLQDEK